MNGLGVRCQIEFCSYYNLLKLEGIQPPRKGNEILNSHLKSRLPYFAYSISKYRNIIQYQELQMPCSLIIKNFFSKANNKVENYELSTRCNF